MAVEVARDDEAHRYEGRVDGVVAGFAAYRLADGLIVFTHTEVDPAYEGQGVGSAIARAALDDVRDAGERQVRATCPFIRSWIERHPDYQSLLEGTRG